MFLGEAKKFAENKFEEILDKVFEIKTKYLVLVNIFRDSVISYHLLLKKIAQTGEIKKLSYTKSEGGDDCIGFLIKKF